MGNTFKLGNYVNGIFQDSSNNIGIGAAPSGSYKFEVTGTAKVSGILTLGSTISNGTYAYTLPSATGTLALTSALGDYVTLATTQTITGAKTFNDYQIFTNAITANSGIAFLNGVMPPITSSYYSGIGGNSQGVSIVTRPVSTNYTNNLYFASSSNTFTFPNATGTLALTTDLGAYLPLAGGTLTGALSGTSATFSGNISTSIGGGIVVGGTTIVNAPSSVRGSVQISGSSDRVLAFGTNSTVDLFMYSAPSLSQISSTPEFQLLVGGTSRLNISTAGAATFSSSVTANGFGAFTAASNGSPVLTLGTAGLINAVINTADEMFFNIDSNNDQTGASFIFGTNRTGTSGGSELVRFQDNGNVGIGTSSPGNKLTVSNAANGIIASFTNTIDADFAINLTSGVTLLTPSTGILAFGTGLTERMRITSTGNVGIGTTTPVQPLQLGQVSVISEDANSMYIGANFGSSTGGNYIKSQYANQIHFDSATGVINFKVAGSGTTGNAISYTTAMRITSAGLVGIGTVPNTVQLDVKNAETGSVNPVVAFRDSSANGNAFQIQVGNGEARLRAVYYSAVTAMNMTFYTTDSAGAEAERLRITSVGSLQYGVAYSSGYHMDTTPSQIAIANGGTINFANFSGMVIMNNHTSGGVTIWLVGAAITTAVANNGTQVGTMAYNGAIAGYTWTNNSGGTNIFGAAIIRTRTTA
jgi:hypothetical protein